MADHCWRSVLGIYGLQDFLWLLDRCGPGRRWSSPVESDFWRFLLISGKVIWIRGTVWLPFSSYPSSLPERGAQSHNGSELMKSRTLRLGAKTNWRCGEGVSWELVPLAWCWPEPPSQFLA